LELQTKTTFSDNRIRILLAIGLAASLVVSIVIYIYHSQQIGLLTEIADKSDALQARDKQILEYTSALAAQKQQIDEKSSQLDSLSSRIVILEETINVNQIEIASKTAEAQVLAASVDAQKDEIQILKGQAARLYEEIQELEDEVRDKENEIGLLTGKVEETQAQLESSKRIKVNHYSVAVTQSEVGIVLPMEVEILPDGEGIVSIDVKNVEFETGFQDSVRTAVTAASEYSDVPISDKDIIIRVVNDFKGGLIRLDGGSAGALIAGMVAVGLMDEEINSSVIITGTIKNDGTIGNVGALDEKANAAADFGAEIILVPEAQEFDHNSISVIGVSDINDVLRYLVS
jgi:predicted ATP-dependent protease